jgi:hypothetical protein
MAWIKLETHIFDKLEVFTIAEDLGIDADAVVGKLCRIWSWFDLNTVDGVTPGVTESLLDRYCGIAGFCKSMIKVGWMGKNDAGLFLPNYDRHNSQTAKDRALTAKRVSKHRKKELSNAECNAKSNAQSLSQSLDREDKIREDIKVSKSPKGTRWEKGFALPDEWIEFCNKERKDLSVSKVFEEFTDYWVSVPGQKGVKLDWSATWRNWIRNQKAGLSVVKSKQAWE